MKMKWFKKSSLDEMQELRLLKIESSGFIGLFLAIVVQIVIYGTESIREVYVGEFIVFLCMGIYLIVECLRNGIWDRHLPATPAVNIGLSLLAAAVTGLFNAIVSYHNYHDTTAAFVIFIVYFLMLSVVIYVTLTVCSALYRRRRKYLEEEREEDAD